MTIELYLARVEWFRLQTELAWDRALRQTEAYRALVDVYRYGLERKESAMKVDQVNLRLTCHTRAPLVCTRPHTDSDALREVKLEHVEICLGTMRVARLLHDPELATYSWGAEVFLPGAFQPARSRSYDDALTQVRRSIAVWLQCAKLIQEG